MTKPRWVRQCGRGSTVITNADVDHGPFVINIGGSDHSETLRSNPANGQQPGLWTTPPDGSIAGFEALE